ncbi:MAG: hypothetical protein R3C68_12525 [Myxococcota bacterium]
MSVFSVANIDRQTKIDADTGNNRHLASIGKNMKAAGSAFEGAIDLTDGAAAWRKKVSDNVKFPVLGGLVTGITGIVGFFAKDILWDIGVKLILGAVIKDVIVDSLFIHGIGGAISSVSGWGRSSKKKPRPTKQDVALNSGRLYVGGPISTASTLARSSVTQRGLQKKNLA